MMGNLETCKEQTIADGKDPGGTERKEPEKPYIEPERRRRAEDGQQMRSEKHVNIGKCYTGVSVTEEVRVCVETRIEASSY